MDKHQDFEQQAKTNNFDNKQSNNVQTAAPADYLDAISDSDKYFYLLHEFGIDLDQSEQNSAPETDLKTEFETAAQNQSEILKEHPEEKQSLGNPPAAGTKQKVETRQEANNTSGRSSGLLKKRQFHRSKNKVYSFNSFDYNPPYGNQTTKPGDNLSKGSKTKSPLFSRILSIIIKTAAIIAMVAFASVYIINSVISTVDSPVFDLLGQSQQLKETMSDGIRNSVVAITAISTTDNAMLAKESSGTGFNISSDGLVITNCHVVENAISLSITFAGGRTCKALTWNTLPEYDLAVIDIVGSELPTISIDSDYHPQQGETLRIIGNPLGYKNLAVSGTYLGNINILKISSPAYSLDIPVYPGNSGSPVINNDDQVIGVITGTINTGENGEGSTLGAAIPIVYVLPLLTNYNIAD